MEKKSNLRFADGIIIIVNNKSELLNIFDRLTKVSEEYGLKINYNKTKKQ